MTIFLTNYLFPVLNAAQSADMEGLLAKATQLITWLVTSMGTWLGFITSHDIILIAFLLFLCGTGIAFLIRIWHSAV